LKRITIIILVAAIMLSEAVVFMIVSQPTRANPTWWNTNWQYRIPITLGSRPENYQVQIVIPSVVPLSDYPSIRFLSGENGYLLPYWIEKSENQYNANGPNIAWVRVLDNSNDSYSSYLGGNTIYMYYHNPGAVSAENGDNVFLFWDDFGGGTGAGGQSALDNSKWGPSGTGVDVYQTALRLQDYSDSDGFLEHGGGQGLTTTEENTKRIIEFRIKDTAVWRGGVELSGPNDSKLEAWSIYPNGGTSGNPPRFFSGGNFGSFDLQTDVWYIGNLIFYGDNSTNKNLIKALLYSGGDNAQYRQLLENNISAISKDWAPGASNTIDKYKPWVWNGGGNDTYYYDWFFVRLYTDPEPSVTFGAVEALPTQPVLSSPANGSITNDSTPTFQWTPGDNANNHRLLVDNDPDFASPSINVLLGPSDNNYTPATPLLAENYSWKVVAINTYGQVESLVWTFIENAAGPPVTGTASIRMSGTGSTSPPFLWGISKVNVTTSLTISQGDNLHLIFLAQDNHTVESDNVIWSRTAPGAQVVTLTNLIVPHDSSLTWPAGGSPSINLAKPASTEKRVKLVLTDNTGAVVQDNMAWYRIVQDDWSNRISWIILRWGSHTSPQQDQLSNEISAIIISWGTVPTAHDQHDFSVTP
jgi:hypothetical protein